MFLLNIGSNFIYIKLEHIYIYLGIIFILDTLIIFLFFVNKFKLIIFKNYEIRNIYSRIIIIIKKNYEFKRERYNSW